MDAMQQVSRRAFLQASLAAPFYIACRRSGRTIRIEDVRWGYEEYSYRAPLKFGAVIVDRVTLLNVWVTVSGARKTQEGFGSMPLSNLWAWPSPVVPHQTTFEAMKRLAERCARIAGQYKEPGHPIDIGTALLPQFLKAADEISQELQLAEPIPKLATLVATSPIDAAIHDAYGKLHGLNCYRTYGPDFLGRDLSHYLNQEFRGEYLDRYVLKDPKPRMPLYHLVGALDPLTEEDIKQRINDGLPETLPEWIHYSGLTHLKIKLTGDDLDWDVERVIRVDRVASEAQKQRGVDRWYYSLDFNERCPSVEALMEFLRRVKERAPQAFERIQYIEQPTKRDLKADRHNVMHQAAKLKPIVVDESLTDFEMLLLAREMGYSGVALKACKGQTESLLLAAAAQKYRMFLCVQDLTCPGASLIHSAGLAAHIPGVAAIEANARQYVPAANKGWEERFPGVFDVRDGYVNTGILTGPGLGAV